MDEYARACLCDNCGRVAGYVLISNGEGEIEVPEYKAPAPKDPEVKRRDLRRAIEKLQQKEDLGK